MNRHSDIFKSASTSRHIDAVRVIGPQRQDSYRMHKPLRYTDTEYMTASSYPPFTSLRSVFFYLTILTCPYKTKVECL